MFTNWIFVYCVYIGSGGGDDKGSGDDDKGSGDDDKGSGDDDKYMDKIKIIDKCIDNKNNKKKI